MFASSIKRATSKIPTPMNSCSSRSKIHFRSHVINAWISMKNRDTGGNSNGILYYSPEKKWHTFLKNANLVE